MHTWTTLNEPWCSAFLGYASGVHAPGRTEPAAALAAVHHLNLAHGLAGRALRDGRRPTAAAVGHAEPARDPARRRADGDRDAVRRHRRARPTGSSSARCSTAPTRPTCSPTPPRVTDWSFVQRRRRETIARAARRARRQLLLDRRWSAPWDGVSPRVERRRAQDVGGTRRGSAATTSSSSAARPVHRDGLEHRPRRASTELLAATCTREYPGQPLMITENGAAFDDVVDADGAVHDADRIDYLRRPHRRGRPRRSTRASTCAATSCGRCWTTSSGRYGYDQAVRHRPRRLRDAGAHLEGQRALVPASRGHRRAAVRLTYRAQPVGGGSSVLGTPSWRGTPRQDGANPSGQRMVKLAIRRPGLRTRYTSWLPSAGRVSPSSVA